MSLKVDILIAGYGPAGATFANLMAKRGFSVAICDSATEIYDKPRAITADHEALRVFQECGLADEIARDTQPHPGTDFQGVDGEIIKRFYPAPPPFVLGWEPSWMFVQPELEATLRQGLQRFAHVQELLGHSLISFKDEGNGVQAHLQRLADGATVHLSAKYLIGADGGRSTVRRQLGSAIDDLAFDEWWIVVDAWITGPLTLPERCVQYCRPSRPGTYIVGPGNLRRWEIKILPGEDPESFQDKDTLMGVLGTFVDTQHLQICRVAVYRFHALVVEQWRQGRVLLMGDAAHQMPPFMGQGLCAAIRDAVNLAWKLEGVEHFGWNPSVLDSYGLERKEHVRTVVEHAKNFGLIIGELNETAARERDRHMLELLRSGQAETIRQKFIPGLSNGLIGTGKGAGDLFVQPWVRTHTEASFQRLDDTTRYGFLIIGCSLRTLQTYLGAKTKACIHQIDATLLVIDSDHKTSQPENSANAAKEHVQMLLERDGIFSQWMHNHQADIVIVRPDRYVYATSAQPEDLLYQLETLIRALTGSTVQTTIESDSLVTQ